MPALRGSDHLARELKHSRLWSMPVLQGGTVSEFLIYGDETPPLALYPTSSRVRSGSCENDAA
jgi:hypothetical protein